MYKKICKLCIRLFTLKTKQYSTYSFREKVGGQNSRDTVPLIKFEPQQGISTVHQNTRLKLTDLDISW